MGVIDLYGAAWDDNEESDARTLWIRWRNIGRTRPSTGVELIDTRLASALHEKTDFTKTEWDVFGIGHVRADHYVKSGASWFKPVAGGRALVAGISQAPHVTDGPVTMTLGPDGEALVVFPTTRQQVPKHPGVIDLYRQNRRGLAANTQGGGPTPPPPLELSSIMRHPPRSPRDGLYLGPVCTRVASGNLPRLT